MPKKIVIISCLFLLFVSCKKAEIPSYLRIDKAYVYLDSLKTDSTEIAVEDIWVYSDGKLQGTYALPFQVPIIKFGEQQLITQGGVLENGSQVSHKVYPFWKNDTALVQLEAGKTTIVSPRYSYFPDSLIKFAYTETFENSDIDLTVLNVFRTDTASIARSQDFYRGQYSGYVLFSDSAQHFEVTNNQWLNLPQKDSPIWLEITYKSNILFGAGVLRSYLGNLELIQKTLPIIADNEWHTVYLNLTPAIYGTNTGTQFKIYLTSNASGEDRYIVFDQIRLVHFK